MVIDYDTYHLILRSFPIVPPETGCILGSKSGVINTIAFDAGTPRFDAGIYSPNTNMLNKIIADWKDQGVCFCGLAHSHPQAQKTLSTSDKQYILDIMKAMPNYITELYFPLVFPGKEIISFVAIKSNNEVEIKPDNITIYKTKE